jgi:hypothetical protein
MLMCLNGQGKGIFMVRRVAMIAMVAVCGVLARPASASAETVTGKLIDLSCYSMDKSDVDNEHAGRGLVCAQGCAREGFAVGLLTADGKVYEVTGGITSDKNAKLVPHMSQQVTLTGDVSSKNGMMAIAASDLTVVNK